MRTGISTTSYKFDKKKEIEFKQFEPFDFWEFWVTNGFTCQYILEKCKKEWNIRKYHLSYFFASYENIQHLFHLLQMYTVFMTNMKNN